MKSDVKNSQSQMITFIVTGIIFVGTYAVYSYLSSSNDQSNSNEIENENKNENLSDAEDEDESKGFKMKIFYGSQSGTAEGFAFDMAKEAKTFGFNPKVIDLEEYDFDNLANEKLVIFLVATYGEGEPTDNSQDFYQALSSEDRDEDELKNVEFVVYGFGNSQYEFFNEMGKKFDLYLNKWGALRLMMWGSGDDDIGSVEDQFTDWKDKLWPLLSKKYLGKEITNVVHEWKPNFTVEFLDEKNEKEFFECATNIKYPFGGGNKFELLSNYADSRLFKPMRSKEWQKSVVFGKLANSIKLRQDKNIINGSTLHIDFDISNVKLKWKTADNLGIVSRNNYKIVETLCDLLKLNPNSIIRIKPMNNEILSLTIPTIIKIQTLFLWFLDINGPVNKKLLNCCAQFSKNDEEKKEILELVNNSVIKKQYLNIVKLLQNYKSIEIPLEAIIDVVKPLKPRLYTISSSRKINENSIGICISLERKFEDFKDETDLSKVDTSKLEPKFFGVMSRYLDMAKKDDMFQLYIETSKFRLPHPSKPIIMIGPGAGIAPFIGFIDEGNYLIKEKKQLGEWWLFFGCRYKNGDFIYEKKLHSSLRENGGCLTKLNVAFSRDQKEKMYVQHLVKQNGEKLWKLISKKRAKVFVCGTAAMGKDIRNTFSEIFNTYNNGQGEEYLERLLKQDIYVQELWG